MKSKIARWGNSLALRLPKNLADSLGLGSDHDVELEVVDGKLIVKPIAAEPTLEELLAKVTSDNMHSEVDWGPPQGLEAW